MLHAVIMAGGSGIRFWPASRRRRPKQLLELVGDRTLLQQTMERLDALVPIPRTLVATGEDLAEAVAGQLPELPGNNLLVEPCGRDTAPCIGLAASTIRARDPDGVMLVLPADHVIEPAAEFRRAVEAAVEIVEEDPEALATFGVTPRYAATVFGYVERGRALSRRKGLGVYEVAAFHEKPDQPTAERYVASGSYYWNCGIFVWRAERILSALAEHKPQMHAAIQRIAEARDSVGEREVLAREFQAIERISIDHAVLEQAGGIRVVQAPFQWDDVGSWEALGRLRGADAEGNTVAAEHCGLQTRNCIIRGQRGTVIATLGVSNLIIVQTPDAILVADRNHQDAMKDLHALLKERGFEEHL